MQGQVGGGGLSNKATERSLYGATGTLPLPPSTREDHPSLRGSVARCCSGQGLMPKRAQPARHGGMIARGVPVAEMSKHARQENTKTAIHQHS